MLLTRFGAIMEEINKEFLIEQYVKLGKTYAKIAAELGCSKHKIMYYAEKHKINSRQGGRTKPNLIGKKISFVTVKSWDSKSQNWICICDCGEKIKRTSTGLLSSTQSMCWDCRNKFISNIKWKGYEEISGEFWGKIIKSAEVRSYKFDITIEQAWNLFISQNRKCALTGVELKFSRKRKNRGNATASLDRINSSIHYTLDNVQWVHKIINNIKMDLPQEEFVNWCSLVTKHNKGK